ncbi:RNA 2',3'-cyclic phosphodiesterase [Picrophilus oshimae]|uniref:RNA 2',3'-cyclic phosphodiesterase n=1 Tax=Picrophilus torridus (strain ATCC 700027 / DSM 9790 / JCM 10055 / NBRC 100828 / KAW 2/3) TaxID=1122961 RepID=Q6L1E4_PICTO|nr:RNA 2',3'-cyclic phosphodiesterase [Picrophilus oshimae]AAT43208.1 2'-5' RNA ligase [Picrophilus oshimae DSM 9789]SMD30487.1 2'-5' RNA ligase [Picrophilus oshimae DSM 9789]
MMKRCFIASPVNIGDEILNNIEFHGKPVSPDIMHITYYFYGNINETKIERICSDLLKIDFKRFKIKITGLGAFPSKRDARIVYLSIKSDELMMLQRQISRLLSLSSKDFIPHITLYRSKTPVKLPDVKLDYDYEITKVCLYESIFENKRIYREICCKNMY